MVSDQPELAERYLSEEGPFFSSNTFVLELTHCCSLDKAKNCISQIHILQCYRSFVVFSVFPLERIPFHFVFSFIPIFILLSFFLSQFNKLAGQKRCY